MNDRVESVRRLFDGWMSFLSLRVVSHGKEVERTLVEHPSGAQVLLYDPARRVAFVGRQFRLGALHLGYPALYEAMGGVADAGDPEACARQEALEEAGVRVETLEFVGHVWMTPSSTTERVHLFLAPYGEADRVTQGGGLSDDHEHIEIEERPLADLWAEAHSGKVFDAKLLLLLQALRIRRPELFQ